LEIFSPDPEAIARARRMEAAYREGEAKGLGAVQVDGVMIDVVVLRMARNTLEKAELYGL
jgi:citrate lyase subunit beta/citryl-CoA lyase